MVHEMIRRERNKASMIFWSVSNETPISHTHGIFDKSRQRRSRTDPTRFITSALIGAKSGWRSHHAG